MADYTQVFISGFMVEYLNGDESYMVSVVYKDAQGLLKGVPDKFSFSTSAKLKKFLNNIVLRTEESDSAEPTTTA